MKIKQELAVFNIPAGRRVSIANQKVPPGMLASISANPPQHIEPARVAGIVLIHQTDLAKVNRLDADFDVARCQKIKPHPRLQLAHVRHRTSPAPTVHEPSIGIKHRLVTEIAVRHGLAEFTQNMFW